MRLLHLPFFRLFTSHLVYYPTPTSLSYLWSLGSLAGLFLCLQILTGVLLTMHYVPHIDMAFVSVEHISRDVSYGWLLRYSHMNGASFFFIAVYLHMAKNIYYRSYYNPRVLLWLSGIIMFISSSAIAFMGYVLPWGQSSFWGATVITNLFTAIPFIGDTMAQWLWGGFSISNATLGRFFSLHYVLPFVLLGFVLIHLFLLHLNGSNTPHSSPTADYITFYPYYYLKDLFSVFIVFALFFTVVCFFPNLLNHPDNYIPANPLSTPTHIVPEWYFLSFYAILRSIPNKLGGVSAMGSSLLSLITLVFNLRVTLLSNFTTRTPYHTLFYRLFFWLLAGTMLTLTWLGAQPIEYPYTLISIELVVYYFSTSTVGIFVVQNLDVLFKRYKMISNYYRFSPLFLWKQEFFHSDDEKSVVSLKKNSTLTRYETFCCSIIQRQPKKTATNKRVHK